MSTVEVKKIECPDDLVQWEQVHRDPTMLEWTFRAKVVGGWLVRYLTRAGNNKDVAMVFIPDPEFIWGKNDSVQD